MFDYLNIHVETYVNIKEDNRRDREVIERNIKIYSNRLANGRDLWTNETLPTQIIKELNINHEYGYNNTCE